MTRREHGGSGVAVPGLARWLTAAFSLAIFWALAFPAHARADELADDLATIVVATDPAPPTEPTEVPPVPEPIPTLEPPPDPATVPPPVSEAPTGAPADVLDPGPIVVLPTSPTSWPLPTFDGPLREAVEMPAAFTGGRSDAKRVPEDSDDAPADPDPPQLPTPHNPSTPANPGSGFGGSPIGEVAARIAVLAFPALLGEMLAVSVAPLRPHDLAFQLKRPG